MARRSSPSPAGDAPRREKPSGRVARFAAARKNQNDLLADCERLLLREADEPQQQNGGVRRNDVIHPSEMAKSDWCPRATYLRILNARAGIIPVVEAHHFQLENIFEEGHEYHRKWQARFRRMHRLAGRWFCEACSHRWHGVSPFDCPECGAPTDAITYHEVGLRDDAALISGSADGEVIALNTEADDVLIEVKSVGEGTIRQEMPQVLMQHTYEVDDKHWKGKTKKVLDHRGVWKDITKPFGPHLRQGLIYLRLRNDPRIQRIVFIYEYKPTSAVKAFYVTRDDAEVEELWQLCGDIVYALDKGGEPPRCIERDGTCKACQEQGVGADDAGTTTESTAPERQRPRSRRAGEGRAAAAEAPEDGAARAARRPVRPRGRRADGSAGVDDALGRLLGRPAGSG